MPEKLLPRWTPEKLLECNLFGATELMENQKTQEFDIRFIGDETIATEIRAVCTKCLGLVIDREV